MLSHDLAHALLARRNNDIRIEVLIDDDPTGETHRVVPVELRDQDPILGPEHTGDDILRYDPINDVIIISAGVITTYDPAEEDHA